MSWNRSRPSSISVPQRIVKASRSSFLVRQDRFSPLTVTLCPRLIRFSKEVLATSQKFSGRLRQARKNWGSTLMRGWLKSFMQIWAMVILRASMILDLWLLNQLFLRHSSWVILRSFLQWYCIAQTMSLTEEKRMCSSFLRSRYLISMMYSVYFAKEVLPISSVPSTCTTTCCPESLVIAFSTLYTPSALFTFISSAPAVKVVKPSEQSVIIFLNILLSSSLRAKNFSSILTSLTSFRVSSSTISSISVKMMRLTGTSMGYLMRKIENQSRNYLPSTQIGSIDPNSIQSWFSLFLRIILSTSLLTCVRMRLKMRRHSLRYCRSGWLELVLLIMPSSRTSYRAMRKVGWLSSLWATLLVAYMYFRHTSPTSFEDLDSYCRNFWAEVALRMQSVQSLKKGKNFLRMRPQHWLSLQFQNYFRSTWYMLQWKSLISTIDEKSSLRSSSDKIFKSEIGVLICSMYSLSPLIYRCSPSINSKIFILRSINRLAIFFSSFRHLQISLSLKASETVRLFLTTYGYCLLTMENLRTVLSRLICLLSSSGMFRNYRQELNWVKEEDSCFSYIRSIFQRVEINAARASLVISGRVWRQVTRRSSLSEQAMTCSRKRSTKMKGTLRMLSSSVVLRPNLVQSWNWSDIYLRSAGERSRLSGRSLASLTVFLMQTKRSLQEVAREGMAQLMRVLSRTSTWLSLQRWTAVLTWSENQRQARMQPLRGWRQLQQFFEMKELQFQRKSMVFRPKELIRSSQSPQLSCLCDDLSCIQTTIYYQLSCYPITFGHAPVYTPTATATRCKHSWLCIMAGIKLVITMNKMAPFQHGTKVVNSLYLTWTRAAPKINLNFQRPELTRMLVYISLSDLQAECQKSSLEHYKAYKLLSRNSLSRLQFITGLVQARRLMPGTSLPETLPNRQQLSGSESVSTKMETPFIEFLYYRGHLLLLLLIYWFFILIMSTTQPVQPVQPVEGVEAPKNKNKQYRKDKPWDNASIDHWKVEAINPDEVKPFLEESSFSVLFPQYREKYVQQCQGIIKKRLMEAGIKFELDLLKGSMTVRTTKKTWDPYSIIKARDVIKLISRSVPYQQALRVMDDNTTSEVIKIRSYVRNKERFIKRRQRLIGPNGDTLKALELLTECYILVQGGTVCLIGGFKNMKVMRRIVVDTMQNVHPIYHIKELMIKRELMKDPALKDENWDRFLPKFKQVKLKKKKKTAIKKKEYTPFPPEQEPRLEDIKMETGEYFLSEKEVQERAMELKQKKQEKKRLEKEEKEREDVDAMNEEEELKKEMEAEKKKSKSHKKKSEPTVEELQSKFLTKPLKKVQF